MVLNRRHRSVPMILAAVVLLSTACSTLFPGEPAETLPPGPAPVVEAGDAAMFEDGTARITEVEAWRHREPVVRERPPCAALCARVRIATSGFEPRALQVTEMWVVRGSLSGRFGGIEAEPDLPGLVVTGQHGPRMDPTGEVALVVRIRRSDGTERLIRSDRVPVEVRG